jgi:hypothetical protein
MRLYEYRQSATSPLKYHLELRPCEMEQVQDLVQQIMDRIETSNRQEQDHTNDKPNSSDQ